MMSLTVSQDGELPLADQIVAGIKRQIDDRHLRRRHQAALDPQFRGKP